MVRCEYLVCGGVGVVGVWWGVSTWYVVRCEYLVCGEVGIFGVW